MAKKIKTVFFGTHTFAATILAGLIQSPLFSVDLVITQPDRPVGRKQSVEKSPVKLVAEKFNIPVQQPATLSQFHIPNSIFQIGVVAQYGLIIPKNILEAPAHGIINVHTSFLPNYRGASPIQSALINGDTDTGVTIMKMDAGLDTGPIILQKKMAIAPDDTYETLEQKLARLASVALPDAIPPYIAGTLIPEPQIEADATMTKQLTRADGRIDWKKTAAEIYNLYRGLAPWPGVWTAWQGKRLKLLSLRPAAPTIPPGQVNISDNKIFIGCRQGSIEALTLQLEGKKEMRAKEFVNGFSRFNGAGLN